MASDDDCEEDNGNYPPPDDPRRPYCSALLIIIIWGVLMVALNNWSVQSSLSQIQGMSSRRVTYKCNPGIRTYPSVELCGEHSKGCKMTISKERLDKVCSQLRNMEKAEARCEEFQGFDLALADNGAKIHSTQETTSYPENCPKACFNKAPHLLTKFLTAGHGWSFCKQGDVQLKIMLPAIIVGFGIHHPENTSLPDGFEISAPKKFSVYGLKEPSMEQHVFGEYEFSLQGRGSQYFAVRDFSPDEFKLIGFKFNENHGNPWYTMVYRVSIFGDTGTPWFLK